MSDAHREVHAQLKEIVAKNEKINHQNKHIQSQNVFLENRYQDIFKNQHKTPGNTVSNLSSTRALRDVTHKHQQTYAAAAVGEVNVVQKMKEISAVIGGEGNGGIIYPELHYGRDALVGVAILLTSIAESGLSMTALKNALPRYEMSKDKISLENFDRVPEILEYAIGLYPNAAIDRTHGVKIDLDQGWIHLRQSNTEPIIRIYTESLDQAQAIQLGSDLKANVVKFLSKT